MANRASLCGLATCGSVRCDSAKQRRGWPQPLDMKSARGGSKGTADYSQSTLGGAAGTLGSGWNGCSKHDFKPSADSFSSQAWRYQQVRHRSA